jgi:hypothetical protein
MSENKSPELPNRCQCCESEDVEIKPYRMAWPGEGHHYYCLICASTYLSNFTTYHNLYTQEWQHIAGAIGWVANRFEKRLDAIEAMLREKHP